jgi:hypothetical protein
MSYSTQAPIVLQNPDSETTSPPLTIKQQTDHNEDLLHLRDQDNVQFGKIYKDGSLEITQISAGGGSPAIYGSGYTGNIGVKGYSYQNAGVYGRAEGASGVAIRAEGEAGAKAIEVPSGGVFLNLPTSNPGVAGQLWADAGVVKVSAG